MHENYHGFCAAICLEIEKSRAVPLQNNRDDTFTIIALVSIRGRVNSIVNLQNPSDGRDENNGMHWNGTMEQILTPPRSNITASCIPPALQQKEVSATCLTIGPRRLIGTATRIQLFKLNAGTVRQLRC